MITELGRLPATNGETKTFDIPDEASAIVFENALEAVIYGRWGGIAPTAALWDFAIPGDALFTLPRLGGAARMTLMVAYPGAVPSTDVQAVIWASSCVFPPFVGAIA